MTSSTLHVASGLASIEVLPVLLLLAAGAALVLVGARRGRPSPLRPLPAALAVCALLVAVHPDAAAVAEESLTGHMLQHLLLMTAVPALLAWSRAPLALVWALPRGVRVRAARPLLRRWSRPATGAALVALFAASLWVWHVPALYDRALDSAALHAAEHATLLAASLGLWAHVALLAEGPAHRRLLAAAWLVAAMFPMLALGAVLTFARTLVYPAHAEAARLAGLAPFADQEVGGLLMLMPSGLVHVGVALGLFASTLRPRRGAAPGREAGAVDGPRAAHSIDGTP
ncbi:MAG: cytochrome c oxidase assembly protein [Dehalococcoidia bacterium]